PFAANQIGLPEEVEERVLGPFFVLKARVTRRRFDHRLHLVTEKALISTAPQLDEVLAKLRLRASKSTRITHPILKDGRKKLSGIGKAPRDRECVVAFIGVLRDFAGDLPAELKGAEEVGGKLLRRLQAGQGPCRHIAGLFAFLAHAAALLSG